MKNLLATIAILGLLIIAGAARAGDWHPGDKGMARSVCKDVDILSQTFKLYGEGKEKEGNELFNGAVVGNICIWTEQMTFPIQLTEKLGVFPVGEIVFELWQVDVFGQPLYIMLPADSGPHQSTNA